MGRVNKKYEAEKVQWDKLRNPSPLFTIFHPTEEKLTALVSKYMNNFLYAADEERDPARLWRHIAHYFPPNGYPLPPTLSLFYEIGKFDGILGFHEIHPSYKCSATIELWNPKLWGTEFARELKDLVNLVIDEFYLKRMDASSPDKRMVKMAKIAGFKTEGAQKNAFMWDGKLYTLYRLGITR